MLVIEMDLHGLLGEEGLATLGTPVDDAGLA